MNYIYNLAIFSRILYIAGNIITIEDYHKLLETSIRCKNSETEDHLRSNLDKSYIMISFANLPENKNVSLLERIFDKLEIYSSVQEYSKFSVCHGNFRKIDNDYEYDWFYNLVLAVCKKTLHHTNEHLLHSEITEKLSLHVNKNQINLKKNEIYSYIEANKSTFMIIDNFSRKINDFALFYNIVINSMCSLDIKKAFPFFLFINIKDALHCNIILEELYKCEDLKELFTIGNEDLCLYQARVFYDMESKNPLNGRIGIRYKNLLSKSNDSPEEYKWFRGQYIVKSNCQYFNLFNYIENYDYKNFAMLDHYIIGFEKGSQQECNLQFKIKNKAAEHVFKIQVMHTKITMKKPDDSLTSIFQVFVTISHYSHFQFVIIFNTSYEIIKTATFPAEVRNIDETNIHEPNSFKFFCMLNNLLNTDFLSCSSLEYREFLWNLNIHNNINSNAINKKIYGKFVKTNILQSLKELEFQLMYENDITRFCKFYFGSIDISDVTYSQKIDDTNLYEYIVIGNDFDIYRITSDEIMKNDLIIIFTKHLSNDINENAHITIPIKSLNIIKYLFFYSSENTIEINDLILSDFCFKIQQDKSSTNPIIQNILNNFYFKDMMNYPKENICLIDPDEANCIILKYIYQFDIKISDESFNAFIKEIKEIEMSIINNLLADEYKKSYDSIINNEIFINLKNEILYKAITFVANNNKKIKDQFSTSADSFLFLNGYSINFIGEIETSLDSLLIKN
ncbi:hypothetical protein COBT_002416 [Conglomerata obtusa]